MEAKENPSLGVGFEWLYGSDRRDFLVGVNVKVLILQFGKTVEDTVHSIRYSRRA